MIDLPTTTTHPHQHTSSLPRILTLKIQLRTFSINTQGRSSPIEAPKKAVEAWTKPNAWNLPLTVPTKQGTLKIQLGSLFVSTHCCHSSIEAPKIAIEAWMKPNAWLFPLTTLTK